jgi:hypothetical protein
MDKQRLGIMRLTLYQLGPFGSVLEVGGKRVLAGRVLHRRDGSLVDNGGLGLCGVRHGGGMVSKRVYGVDLWYVKV